jgi:hypothetical protein
MAGAACADEAGPVVTTAPTVTAEARASRWRRAFLGLYLLTAAAVALGVLLQAFSIAAYVRGAGAAALDMHQAVGFATHSVEIVVFVAALVGYWGIWRRIGLAFLLPVLGTIQLLTVGDTDESGGWINGLHGLLALLVLLLAVGLAADGKRSLERAWRDSNPRPAA